MSKYLEKGALIISEDKPFILEQGVSAKPLELPDDFIEWFCRLDKNMQHLVIKELVDLRAKSAIT